MRYVLRSLMLLLAFSAGHVLAPAQNPTVVGIATIDSTHIDVTFSQAMSATALTASHYALSGSGKGTLATNPDTVALQSGDTYRLTWNSGDMKNGGAITITVSGVTDMIGNPLGSPNSATLPTGGIGTAPTVTSVAAVDPLHIDVTFSEPMDSSALVAGHYSLSGSGKGSLNTTPASVAAQADTTYRLTWPSGDMLNGADITITVSGTTDAAGNAQGAPSAATQVGGAIGTLPTVVSVIVVDLLHVDVTFSETMANGSGVLTAGSYALSGGGRGTLAPTPASVSTAGVNTYRLAWTSGDMINGGDVTITVSAGTDLVGNPIGSPNNATQPGGAIGTLPTVTGLTVDDASRMSVTFSELMGAGVLNPANYTLSGGGRGSFAIHPDSVTLRSNSTYRLFWNAGEMVNGGDITIGVAGTSDVAGNPLGATDSATVVGGGIGTIPTIVTRAPLAGSSLQVLPSIQLTFSEPVTGVAASGLTVSGSPATALTGSGVGPYTFSGFAAPPEGTTTVTLTSGAIQDAVGNLFAGDVWSYAIDRTPPTVQTQLPPPAAATNALATVQVTFSEPVTGVTPGIFTVGGNAASAVSGSGAGPYAFSGFVIPPEGVVNLTLSAGGVLDLAANAFAGASWSCTLDATPPASSASVLHATRVGTTTLMVDFDSSDNLSGVAATHLYVLSPDAATWVDSGLTRPGTGGSFAFTSATLNGLYRFATAAVDMAGNTQNTPSLPHASVLLNTVENGPFTWATPGGHDVLLFPMTNDLNVTVTLSGASPGTVTVSRSTPIRAAAPPYFQAPAQLLDERLTVTMTGTGPQTSATLLWAFDPANAPAQPIDRAWAVTGAQVRLPSKKVSVFGSVLTIDGIQASGEWLAGNAAAAPNAAHRWTHFR